MEVSNNLKIDVFEHGTDPWVQLYFVRDRAPNEGGFTMSIFESLQKKRHNFQLPCFLTK